MSARIRCFCNTYIGNYDIFLLLLQQGFDKETALDCLEFTKYCCRAAILKNHDDSQRQ